MRTLFMDASWDWNANVWKLIAIALIFFMQAGFAMCEAGFTRPKNTGNITMKNLMDFCLGTVTFIILGGPILCAENALVGGIFGDAWNVYGDIFGNPGGYDWTNFIFNLVFCATTATIVSGAMAERTNFKAYCIYSMIISAIVYPVEAFWVWGAGGWLANASSMLHVDFIDLSGSAAIHMVGGLTALIGAKILGPRIGKYVKKADGTVEVKAIPGHNLLIGALGVFILWFGWYGFNAAGCVSDSGYGGMGQVFMTTTVAAAIATVVTMMITWIRNGKPDVSMCLNGSLAGLVAITAGCNRVDLIGSIVIGAVAGCLLCFGVEFIDKVLHIDDPVGACSVHFLNGVWGTLACGLFSYDTGLFYGHGGWQLLVQVLGILAICAWTAIWAVAMFGIMKAIKRKDGSPWLRATYEEEIKGLDITEHGLVSAYSGFVMMPETVIEDEYEVLGDVPQSKAIDVVDRHTPEKAEGSPTLTKVEIICRQRSLETLKNAMQEIGITGMTVTNVMGCGIQKGQTEYYRGVAVEVNLLPKIQVEMVISKVPVQRVVETAKKVLYTGHIGDGKIFIYDVLNVIKVRTGEQGYDALQDDAGTVE